MSITATMTSISICFTIRLITIMSKTKKLRIKLKRQNIHTSIATSKRIRSTTVIIKSTKTILLAIIIRSQRRPSRERSIITHIMNRSRSKSKKTKIKTKATKIITTMQPMLPKHRGGKTNIITKINNRSRKTKLTNKTNRTMTMPRTTNTPSTISILDIIKKMKVITKKKNKITIIILLNTIMNHTNLKNTNHNIKNKMTISQNMLVAQDSQRSTHLQRQLKLRNIMVR